ncbi:MAG: hypothetical protein JSV93_04635 [Candidatus Omnitrophota bacterium]|nr:MAG: hypothetical protein JSV93_04635 [Candidatus Omnitrophota bacterium]
MKKKITISFASLVHTGHSCNAVPYGMAMVASYALKNLGDKIKVDLFSHPDSFIAYLGHSNVEIACFSNYIWNMRLSYEFAKRIKKKSPKSIIVFGGPNYPFDVERQKEFLLSCPDIDFYIYRDGERAFVELFNSLLECNFDTSKIKKNRLKIPSCHYITEGKIIQGDLTASLSNLDEIPSAYLSGLCDKFLDKKLMPLLQTTRGCPFQCTYCTEGHKYFNVIKRFSSNRIGDEFKYIAEHTTNPKLMLADANFGMYREDLEIAKELAKVREKYNWPKYFTGISGKNRKDRILKAASITQASILQAAVQSTDRNVLANIKRENVSLDQMIQLAKAKETLEKNSFSELILCLPGDTKKAHFKSNFELMDASIAVIRSHQLIMLPGSELSTEKSRKLYGMVTRFRVTPDTANPYRLFEKTFFAPEIDEICVANNTMSFEDYLECRKFDLTVEIFYNDRVFQELIKFLKLHNISAPSFIMGVHTRAASFGSPLFDLYEDFLRENKELWNSRDELTGALQEPNMMERYISGELGNNEQLLYRALAIFNHIGELHKIAFDAAREILTEEKGLDERHRNYLEELFEFSLLRKRDMLLREPDVKKLFHYDFISLLNSNFADDPLLYYKPEGTTILFTHTDEQRALVSRFEKMYGFTKRGLGNILSHSFQISRLYRKVCAQEK